MATAPIIPSSASLGFGSPFSVFASSAASSPNLFVDERNEKDSTTEVTTGENEEENVDGSALDSKHLSSKLFSSTDDDQSVVIVGGGIAGLSIAHYLATNSNKRVTLLDRTGPTPSRGVFKTECSSSAAEGFLGQQFFGVNGTPYQSIFESGEYEGGIYELDALLSMCLKSRDMYDEWTKAVEEGAKNCPIWAAEKYWWDEESELERWEVGYRSDHTTIMAATAGLDQDDALKLQPFLNGLQEKEKWSFISQTASVDAQRLLCSLRAACAGAGVDMRFGENWGVTSLLKDENQNCIGVNLKDGNVMGCVVVASGPALNELMGEFGTLPVHNDEGDTILLETQDKKSQFMDQPVMSEKVSVLSKPGGRVHISSCRRNQKERADDAVNDAANLVPAVSELESLGKIKSLRPFTQDYFPILGTVEKDGTIEKCDNLYVAGGFNTYGIMLAPKTGKLIGDLILCGGDITQLGDEERSFLNKCKPVREVTNIIEPSYVF